MGIHGKSKNAEMELLKGKQMAILLQTLMQNPDGDLDPVSMYGELTVQILASFSNSITLLNELPELTQIAAVDGGGSSCSAESMKRVKDRRGCYKRRNSSNSWTTVSETIEDGRAWRKYGQKKILNSENPRCYYRCTHKPQGCKAKKQVQKQPEEPFLYHITYFNNHTCTDKKTMFRAPHADPDLVEPNLLSFRHAGNAPQNNTVISQVKEDYSFVMEEDEEESKEDIWKDILQTGPDPYWFGSYSGSGFHSSGSTSFNHRLDDVEVNQLDDIENLHFD